MAGISSGLEGLARAQASFERTAAKIAQPTSVNPQNQPNQQDQVSLSDEMVALMQARNDYQANLKTLQTGDQIQKTLLHLLG
jgi:flagellar hook-associated protein FlgK